MLKCACMGDRWRVWLYQTCSELTEDDDDAYIALVIARALGLPMKPAPEPAAVIERAAQHDIIKVSRTPWECTATTRGVRGVR